MHLHRLQRILLVGLCVAGFFPLQTLAASHTSLVKGSGTAVYFKTADGKRSVFPNASIFSSWYQTSQSITQLNDADLAALPLGANMTYRPGSTLVKITTDPKVYAVSRYGVLRWVTSEALAASLYENDWNKKVVDVPDAFFINYTVGEPILTADAYAAAAEMDRTPVPQANIKTSAPLLAITGAPSKNYLEISYFAPLSAATATTAIVDGTAVEDKAIAICDSDCHITLQVNIPGSITAFTTMNGTSTRSNTIEVAPE